MEEICEIVPSQKGFDKLNAHGYLMVKEKSLNNRYYWCCESRKLLNCKGRAITIFSNGQHILKKTVDHNHSPNASAANVSKIIGEVKNQAKNTKDAPCQIIQSCTTTANPEIVPCLPSKNALRQKIKRIRQAHHLPESKTIIDVEVPLVLQKTLNAELFLVKDSTLAGERLLMFTTKASVEKLAHASMWIMDGTFKTVPTIFYQLYTIHAPVCSDTSRTYPLVYILMTGKSESLYKRLFEALVDFADENGLCLNPRIIMTDPELSVIKATKSEFEAVTNNVCFFHFGRCIWRRLQSSGLAIRYGNDENFSLKLRHLFALAFLPSAEIPGAFDELKLHLPDEAHEVVDWFETNYVRGRIRKYLLNGVAVRSPPLFPPNLWSLYECFQGGFPRTQNYVEAWHRRWENLVMRMSVFIA
ncbi:uncharacterized protein [Palaemon carinicauda]|uniref:uncharacterized protein n=1 Tax=Palaemon carinicauda TaxID=392227 RepID=UPI0035B6A104